MKKILALSLFVFVAGCTTATPITGPDGSTNQLISCPAVEQCYAKATEVCGKYKIVNTSTQTDGSKGETSTTTKMLVECLR